MAALLGDRIFALSASQISRRIADAARAAGLGEGYSGHSPRIGMAMDLVRKKQSLVAIQNVGRWRSAVMPARYARGLIAGQNAVAEFYEDEDEELYEEDGGGAAAGAEDGRGRVLRPAFPSAG